MKRQAYLQVVELYVWKAQENREKMVRNKRSPERELVAKLIYKD